ncbi:MAG: trypsin-like peptidase domain-containing protein [Patescibacteria group bacterium]|nr:trypsin-like peptidase domain-containing protein [Patescibacteria group bacterium]MDD4610775.1 trypsin-like peptidase domain-containing protein [Patescibacteria group bacterium]
MKKNISNKLIILFIIFSLGISLGLGLNNFLAKNISTATADSLRLDDQEATIRAIQKIQPAVVSIVIYGQEEIVNINLSTGKQTKENKKTEKGAGTGFIINADGLILTNKHVVNAAGNGSAEYEVILNNGKKYDASLISKDPINDLAVLKIKDSGKLPCVELGDSNKLQIGTTVIAIGNALGRYQNSATKGIVSGLGRHIVASDQIGASESLDNVIQTDAEINPGNSGGPLVDLNGKVVGVNVAIDQSGSSIGFAIPINDVKSAIASVTKNGKIVRTYLGIRYVMITPEIVADKNLPRNYGALIIRGSNGEVSVMSNSPAAYAGLTDGDIIFEVNAIKIEGKNTLLSVLQRFNPGNKIGLKIQRGNETFVKTVVLEEFK